MRYPKESKCIISKQLSHFSLRGNLVQILSLFKLKSRLYDIYSVSYPKMSLLCFFMRNPRKAQNFKLINKKLFKKYFKMIYGPYQLYGNQLFDNTL